jgi:hypothetical protein
MRTTIVFFAGVIASILVAAAAFRGGTPVDYTFTYQGQLRNAGALVNGPVDLRITLWDSDVAGGQVGPINNYQAVPITDGRFALGLNFGATAFDGSNRWVQLEFRSPAGSGQYLTLNPRDKIMATPYAMFALNGGNGIWNYNAESQSVSVLGQKVGIGTSTPTALLEVVGTGGDDSVKLPAGSVGKQELSPELLCRSAGWQGQVNWAGQQPGGNMTPINRTFTVQQSGVLCFLGLWYGSGSPQLLIDGVVVGTPTDGALAGTTFLQAGTHSIQFRDAIYHPYCQQGWNCYTYTATAVLTAIFTPEELN